DCNALQSVIAVLMALRHRARTGEGLFVHTSLLSAGIFYNSDVFLTEGGASRRPRLDQQQTGLSPLYRLYETKEGRLCLACLTEAHWAGLGRAIPGLAAGGRFVTADRRETNAAALAGVLEVAFRERTAAQWFATLDAAGVP